MSLLGYNNDDEGATLNGLNNINANFVFGDELYYDVSTTPVNVKTAINGITVDVTALEADVLTLQGQMTTANSNISTLQGQYTTLNGEVNTLQSEMNTAQSDINTLQSEMNTAQSDIGALYGLSATNSTAIAGLSVSQASQDVIISAHTASIAGLNGDVFALDNRVDNLEVKTADQSWGSLTGTSFSSKVNVGGGSGVVLNTSTASEFNSGIVCSTITSTSPTTNINIGQNLTTGDIFMGTTFIGPTMNIALNWGSSSNGGILNLAGGSFNLLSSGIYTQRSGPTFGMNIADTQTTGDLNIATGGSKTGAINIGTGASAKTITLGDSSLGTNIIRGQFAQLRPSQSGACSVGDNMTSGFITIGRGDTNTSSTTINIGNGTLFTGAINIGGGTTGNAPITIGSTASTTQTVAINGITTVSGTTNINTTTFSNTTIGNGGAGGNITLNGAVNTITGTTNTLTSTGETEINSSVLDINASGAITIDGATTTAITSVDDLTIQTTNPFGDILVSSAGTSTFTSSGQTQINSSILDINATGAMTLDSTSTIAITGTTNTILGTTNINRTGTATTSIGNTGALTLNGSTYSCITTGNQTVTSSGGDVVISGTDVRLNSTGTGLGEFIVRANTNVDIKTTTGNIVSDANTTHDLISGGIMTLTAGDGLVCSTTNLSADMTFTAQNSLLFEAIDGFWTAKSSSNYYYQSGNDAYIVTYGNQTGSQFLSTEFSTGATPQATIKSTSHKVRIESDVETLLGKDASPTTIDGSTINLSGNTVQDVGFTNNMMPTATIIQNVSATVPSGFLYCNGQAVNRLGAYARLFAAIGTTFGVGNGTTTFNVPNFQGAFLRGAGTQTVSSIAYTAGAVGTAQQDMALTTPVSGYTTPLSSTGFRSCGSGTRDCLARTSQGDPIENPTGLNLAYPTGRGGTEVRPMNYSVYYYIRF